MAVAFGAVTQGVIGGASSQTLSHTVGSGSDRVLYVFSVCLNSTDYLASSTVTYGGTSLGSPIGSRSVAGSQFMYVWRMLAPPSGAANVVITPSAGAFLHTFAISLEGVDQTTPNGTLVGANNAFPTSPINTAITVAAGGMAIDMASAKTTGVTFTPQGSQTQSGTTQSSGVSTSASSRLADATQMGWAFSSTSGGFLQIAVPVNPSGGGGGGITGSSSITLGAVTSAAAGLVSSGVVGESAITLGAVTSAAAGEVTGFGAITGSSSIALGDVTSATAGAVGATLTIGPFKNKSGTVLSGTSIGHLVALNRASRAVALSQASLTTDGSGMLAVRDSSLVPGTDYMVATWSTDGASAGNAKVTAAVA